MSLRVSTTDSTAVVDSELQEMIDDLNATRFLREVMAGRCNATNAQVTAAMCLRAHRFPYPVPQTDSGIYVRQWSKPSKAGFGT